jgi:hypothetical protein
MIFSVFTNSDRERVMTNPVGVKKASSINNELKPAAEPELGSGQLGPHYLLDRIII